MKKFLCLIFVYLLFSANANSEDIRTVERANIDEAWQVDGKFIKPECFDFIMVSGDRYQAFYDEYFGKPNGSHWDDANFIKFVDNVGDYLNKEVPLNHSIDAGWGDNKKLSLTKQLDGCLSEVPETAIRFSDETGRSSSTVEYKVQHNFDRYLGRKLAPYIDQNFESVKQVEIVEWGGGSMPPETHMIVFGVLELEGKKVLLPLRNRSILTETSKRDTFFRGSGRFSYEAEFDLNDNITKIININDFKQMVSSNGCFKIDEFAVDGKIYKFLKEKNLKEYCNEVRPFTDINWFLNQREFKDNSDLIFNDPKHRFSNLIRSQVPDIQVPWTDKDIRLAEELLDTIWFSGKIKYLNNGKQVAVSGCVYQFCSQKGFVFVYENNLIGLIKHSGEDFDDDFLIFSNKHKSLDQLPESFFNAVKEWITETNGNFDFKVIDPKVVRFVGSDNKIKITENVFVENNVKLEKKGWLGVRVGDNVGDGIRVVSTTLAGPADNAGIKTNDIIISLNSNQIKTTKELVEQVSKNKPGEIVDLELIRDGKKLFIKVELGSRNLNKTKNVNKEKNINNKWMFNENSSAVRVEKLGESDLSGTFTYALQKNKNKCDLMTIYFSSMSNGNSDLNELLGLKIPIKINTLGPIEAMIVNIRPAFDINTINNLDLSKEQINKMSSLQNVTIQIGDPRPIDSYDFESVAKKIKIDFVKVDEFDPSKYFSKLSTTWDLSENRTAVEKGRSMCGQKKGLLEDKNENLNAIKTAEKALENCADNYFINKTDINEFSQTLYSQNSEIQRLEKDTEPLKEKLRSISSQFEIEFKEWEEENPKPFMGIDGETDFETYKRKLKKWNKASDAAFYRILDNLSGGDHKRLEVVYTKIERLIRSEVAKYVKSKDLTLSNKVKEVDGYLEVYTACEEAYQDSPSSFMLLWSD